MPKWNGGVIGVANNPTQSSAKGIWSLSEATKAIRAGLWPPSNAGADPYFENVTLLLPGDGTNGAQNNTFLDSSTNNFTITRNGNTTQGTFTPFSKADGRWSNYFDGNGDFLNYTQTGGVGNSNFTLEFWLYPTAIGDAIRAVWDSRGSDSGTDGFFLGSDTSNFYLYTGGAKQITATTPSANTWTHVALVRSGNDHKLYFNGTQVGSTYTAANNYSSTGAYISRYFGSGLYYTSGYLSSMRLVKGTAVYTAAFTTPTAPLTAITNTSLLTCQSNRFIDNSTNAFAITRNGDVSVQTFSPFPTLTAYAAGTNGGSGYFDGSGDYLSMTDNASFNIGSNAFSIELWYYAQSTAAERRFISQWDTGNKGIILTTQNQTPSFVYSLDGTSDNSITSSTTPAINQWNHLVVCRSGSTLSMFLNGSRVATATQSGTFFNATGGITIGSGISGAVPMDGYFSSLRSVIGSSPYDATQTTITVPTAPVTNITNTSLLLSFTNGGIIDTSMSNDLETVGNAQISTTQSKFGGASMYFDGTGDYLDARLGPVQVLGGDFTVEMWVYPTTITGSNRTFLFLENGSNSAAFFMYGATGYVGLDISNVATYNLGSTAITTNSWQHLAFVRSGSTLTAYINGTSVGTATVTASLGSSGVMRIGAGASAGAPYFGYFDEMRVTKGYARYTTNFTAPISPFNGFGD